MNQAIKVVPKQFPMTRSSQRIALLAGVLANAVGAEEIKYHMALDAEPRPARKPVVAFGHYFGSIVEAAEWALANNICGPRSVDSWRKHVARRCNQDCWEGFYWSE